MISNLSSLTPRVSSLVLFLLAASTAGAAPQSVETAARVDALLAAENFGGGSTPAELAPRCDDEIFLRRLSLDLVGTVPSPEHITGFLLDTAADKRQQAVERFLADGEYGQNWARYWRDVILSRRKDDRALFASPGLTNWLTEEFNRNTPWNEIAQEFIAARRNVGATAIILAQAADPADTAAEISRILLGIQIQCAQCHNHPTDRWQRRQFHELAAFFPRIGLRPDLASGNRFAVVSLNQPHQRRTPADAEEVTLEHFMPDLEHPQAQGTLVQPVLFTTGQQLETGLDDLARRERLAQWITAPDNRWFARALVNRLWAELVGQGFFEPVDDMGPDREPRAGKAFEELTTDFIASGYDVKWLLRTITATEAYQRESRSRHDEGRAPFAASSPQRLRADQLFNVLTDALEIEEKGADPRRSARQGAAGQLAGVIRTFGYDPSIRRDEVAGSIGQALWMMNSYEISLAVDGGSSHSVLGRLSKQWNEDRSVVAELYLRLLTREPRPAELTVCLDHIESAGDRTRGLEDVLWAILNSTEFLYRR